MCTRRILRIRTIGALTLLVLLRTLISEGGLLHYILETEEDC